MSITGTKKVSAGEFAMNFAAVEASGGKCGERGTITFTPNAKAKDTNSLRLVQVVKLVDASTGGDYKWTGGESRRNDAMTRPNHAQTLGTIGGALAGAAVGGIPGAIVGGAVGNAVGRSRNVEGGWFVDRVHGNMTPRTNSGDAAVSPYYIDDYGQGSSGGHNQDGFKKGASVKAASLWDFPGWTQDSTFRFETAAKGSDNNVVYGTVRWSFAISGAKIKNEQWSVTDSPSATFNAAVEQFNKTYRNPGASTAP